MLASINDILGTTFWSVLVFVVGFGCGIFWSRRIKNLLK